MRKAIFALAATAVLTASARPEAFADSIDGGAMAMIGTMEVVTEPYLQDGKLVGCMYRFNQLVLDEKYEIGSLLKVDGSVGIILSGQIPAGVLKVVVHRMSKSNGQWKVTPSSPTRAYLVSENFKSSIQYGVEPIQDQSAGSILLFFDAATGLYFMQGAATTSKLRIAFNQSGGKSDILFELDMAVTKVNPDGSRQRSVEAVQKFNACIDSFSKVVKQ